MEQAPPQSLLQLQFLLGQTNDEEGVARLDALLANTQRLASIGSLTSSVAHELANLLTLVTAACGSLLDALHDDATSKDTMAHYVELIEQNAFRSAHLVHALHNYGSVGLSHPAVTDAHSIVGDALALVQRQFSQEANVHIAVALPAAPRSLICDHGAIVQMLVNLLTNARDALLPGGGLVELGYEALPACQPWLPVTGQELPAEAHERIAFYVRDQGHGIAPGQQEIIFAPFFSTKGTGGHTGLGLTIAQAIAQQHHGRIWAQNNNSPARGATFIVLLPARPRSG